MLSASKLQLKAITTGRPELPPLKIVAPGRNIKKKKKKTLAMLQAQEKERNAIGTELHDNVNQVLAAAKLYLQSAMNPGSDKDREIFLKKGHDYVVDAIAEIRKMSHKLVTPSVREITLVGAIKELLKDIRTTTSLHVKLIADNYKTGLIDEEHKIMLYRVIQEQVNNIIKHADAKNVTVTLCSTSSQVMLTVRDDGKGFDLAKAYKGIGMRNIRNRADCLNAGMKISSSPGQGCSLSICIPL